MQDFTNIFKAISTLEGILEKHPGDPPHDKLGEGSLGQKTHAGNDISFGKGSRASLISVLSAARDMGHDVPARDSLDGASDKDLWWELAGSAGSPDNAVQMLKDLPEREHGEALRASDVPKSLIDKYFGPIEPAPPSIINTLVAARSISDRIHNSKDSDKISPQFKEAFPKKWADLPVPTELEKLSYRQGYDLFSETFGAGADLLIEKLWISGGDNLPAKEIGQILAQHVMSPDTQALNAKAENKQPQQPVSPPAAPTPSPRLERDPGLPPGVYSDLLGREADRDEAADVAEALILTIGAKYADDPAVRKAFANFGISDPTAANSISIDDALQLGNQLVGGDALWNAILGVEDLEGPLGTERDIKVFEAAYKEKQYVDQLRAVMQAYGVPDPSADEAILDALLPYTGAMSGPINVYLAVNRRPAMLRGRMAATFESEFRNLDAQQISQEIDAYIEKLDTIFANTKPYSGPPITLQWGAEQIDPSKLREGVSVISPSFISTSLSPSVSAAFDSTKPPIQITVDPRNNVKILNVNEALAQAERDSAAGSSEEEFILPRSTRLRIDRIDADGTIHATAFSADEASKDAIIPYKEDFDKDVPATPVKDPKQDMVRGWYQEAGYLVLNGYLRDGVIPSEASPFAGEVDEMVQALGIKPSGFGTTRRMQEEALVKAAEMLDKAISKNTLKKPLIVYRGIKDVDFGSLQPGREINLDGFTSTTVKYDVANAFGRVMQIDLPAGQPYLRMATLSTIGGDEAEVLLPRNQRLIFNYIDDNGVAHMTAVPADERAPQATGRADQDRPVAPPAPRWVRENQGGKQESSTKKPVTGVPDYSKVKFKGRGSAAGGSNDAAILETEDGEEYLVKGYDGDANRVATELVANALYRELGARVPEAGSHPRGLVYPLLDAEPIDIGGVGYASKDDPRWKAEGGWREMGKFLMLDGLVYNRDMIGVDTPNVLWDEQGPIRIDQGATFQFRGMGGRKDFGPNPQKDVEGIRLLGQGKKFDVTYDELKEQAREISQKLTRKRIDSIFNSTTWDDPQMREEVRRNLLERVGWMKDFADGKVDFSKEFKDSLTAMRKRYIGAGRLPLRKRGAVPYRLGLNF